MERIERLCQNCKQPIEDRQSNAIYCLKCAYAMKKERNRKYMEKIRHPKEGCGGPLERCLLQHSKEKKFTGFIPVVKFKKEFEEMEKSLQKARKSNKSVKRKLKKKPRNKKR